MHQDCHNTPDATEGDGFVEILFRLPVQPDGPRENPKNRAKHQNAARQAELGRDFQVIAVRVLNEKSEESGLHGRINHGEGPQSSPEERMMADQSERIAPDRNAALAAEIVFLPESFKTAHHGI